jgi:hypothetical protein
MKMNFGTDGGYHYMRSVNVEWGDRAASLPESHQQALVSPLSAIDAVYNLVSKFFKSSDTSISLF